MYNAHAVTHYTDYGISHLEYLNNPELRTIIERVLPARKKQDHNTRVMTELQHRAGCGAPSEDSALKLANLRNRQMLESDYQRLQVDQHLAQSTIYGSYDLALDLIDTFDLERQCARQHVKRWLAEIETQDHYVDSHETFFGVVHINHVLNYYQMFIKFDNGTVSGIHAFQSDSTEAQRRFNSFVAGVIMCASHY